jgi:serine/threonine protein kinase
MGVTGETGQIGDPRYAPPEQYEGNQTSAGDAYSFALILYELCLGTPVIELDLDAMSIVVRSLRGKHPKSSDSLNEPIISKSWARELENQPPFDEIFRFSESQGIAGGNRANETVDESNDSDR